MNFPLDPVLGQNILKGLLRDWLWYILIYVDVSVSECLWFFSGSKWSLRKHEFIIRVYFRSVFFLYILYDNVTTKPHFYSNFIHICVTKKRCSFFISEMKTCWGPRRLET